MFISLGVCVQANPPEVTSTAPLAVAAGKSSEVGFHGRNLSGASQIWTSFSSASDSLAGEAAEHDALLRTCINIPSHAPVGVFGARLATSRGVSEPILMMVDDLPSVPEKGQHRSLESAQEIHPPIAVDGAGDGAASDYYAFPGQVGQWYSIEVVSSRLGYAFDPRLRVLDAEGHQVAAADDSPGLNGDCRVRFRASRTQRYVIEVVDAAYSSGSRHKYRLRVGDFPIVSTPFPLAINPGDRSPRLTDADSPGRLAVGFCTEGDAIAPATVLHEPSLSDGRTIAISSSWDRGGGSAFCKLAVSSLPNVGFVDHQPNIRRELALPVGIPVGVNGVFRKASDTFYYQFQLAQGERVKLRGLTRSLGSPADLLVKVLAPDGKPLATNDDFGLDEATLEFAANDAGDYAFSVQEVHGRFGPQFSYRVEAVHAIPDFELTSSADRVIVGEGSVGWLPVACKRLGYQGPITLRIEDSTAPFRLQEQVIAAGQNSTLLRFVPDSQVRPGSLHMLRIVGESQGDGPRLAKRLNLVDSLRKRFPSLPYPPAEICDQVAVAMAQPLADFFGMRMAAREILFPRVVGETYFTTFCTERMLGFQDAINLEVVGLPAGFSVSGHERPVGNSQNSEYRFALQGPKSIEVGRHEISVRATGEYQGQLRQVRLDGVPLRIVDPLIVSLELGETSGDAGDVVLRVVAQRFVPRGGGDRKEIRCTWKTLPSWIAAPDAFVVGAGQNEANVAIKLAVADSPQAARQGQMAIVAETIVEGRLVKVESEPIAVRRGP